MTGHDYRRLPLPQAHLPQPGPGPLHQPRDEPLHPVLPLRAVLPRLRRRRRPATSRRPRPRLLRPPRGRRAGERVRAATWWRSARPACSPTRRSSATTPASGTRRPRRRSASHCGLGCNTIPGERYGTLRRIRNRYNGEVNGYFLCDRGRFGYEFVNDETAASASSPTRSRRAPRWADGRRAPPDSRTTQRRGRDVRGPAARDRWPGVRSSASARPGRRSSPTSRCVRWWATRTSSTGLPAARTGAVEAISILPRRVRARVVAREVEQADAVLVLGEDLDEDRPRSGSGASPGGPRNRPMASARSCKIRTGTTHAVRDDPQDKRPALHRHSGRTTLDRRSRRRAPPRRARRRRAAGLRRGPRAWIPSAAGRERTCPSGTETWPAEIAGALAGAERPLVVAGPGCGSRGRARGGGERGVGATGRRPDRADLSSSSRSATAWASPCWAAARLEEAARRGARTEDRVDCRRRPRERPLPATPSASAWRTSCSTLPDTWSSIDSPRHRDDRGGPTWSCPPATFAERHGHRGQLRGARAAVLPGLRAERHGCGRAGAGCATRSAAGRDDAAPWDGFDDCRRNGRRPCPPSPVRVRRLRRRRPAIRRPARFPDSPPVQRPHGHARRPGRARAAAARRPGLASHLLHGGLSRESRRLRSCPLFWAPGWNSIQAVNKFQEEIAGPLRGGDPGVRLLERRTRCVSPATSADPAAGLSGAGAGSRRWLVIPRHMSSAPRS